MRPVLKPNTLTELEGCLRQGGVTLTGWGAGQAKTSADLLTEIRSGESQLVFKDGQLTRKVRALAIDVWYRDVKLGVWKYLYEKKQVFEDGRTRRRRLWTSLGEKLRAGEMPNYAAVSRALAEELVLSEISHQHLLYLGDWHEKRPSSSYPGLISYHYFSFWWYFLQPEQYLEQYQEVQPRKKTTYWRWLTAGYW